MTGSLVFDVPVELGLELMPVARPHFADTEWGALDDVIEEVDGIGLGVPAVDLEGPDTCGVIDGGVLIAFDRLSVLSRKIRNLTMTWIGDPGPVVGSGWCGPCGTLFLAGAGSGHCA